MAQQVRGVVSHAKGEPVTIETIEVPDPGPGEAVVAVKACGVCHTDLHYREGAINDEFPFLLGHEAAGVVESVGDGVEDVAAGDYVVLAWRAPCGTCRSCVAGQALVLLRVEERRPADDARRPAAANALGIGAFAEKTLVAAGQCVKVDPAAPPEAAGLIGCGVMAGFGAAVNTGEVQRGETVAVFGCGGRRGRRHQRAPRWPAPARSSPSTSTTGSWSGPRGSGPPTRSTPRAGDPVEAIQALTDGLGVDVAIEAIGLPQTFVQAFNARDLAGRLVLVGVPSPDVSVELPMIEVFGRGGSTKSSWYGDCLPSRDFPLLIDMHLSGRIDLTSS